MIKIENVDVYGLETAIRGMRNPLNSWDKSDSKYIGGNPLGYYKFVVGENDLKLMRNLAKAGNDHGKFMRMINVSCDVTCNHVWWAEFDTYKVGTVRNSCSKMHKIHVKEFVKEDFSHEGIDVTGEMSRRAFDMILNTLNWLREKFNETNEKKYWRAMIELLPMGYNIRATVQLNYAVLKNMYHARKNHKLDEWREFCKWVESLPYADELIVGV